MDIKFTMLLFWTCKLTSKALYFGNDNISLTFSKMYFWNVQLLQKGKHEMQIELSATCYIALQNVGNG